MIGKPICFFGIIAISTLRQRSGFFFKVIVELLEWFIIFFFPLCFGTEWMREARNNFNVGSKTKFRLCFLVRSTQRTILSQPKQRRATQVEALGVTQATWNLRMETVSDALSVFCKRLKSSSRQCWHVFRLKYTVH